MEMLCSSAAVVANNIIIAMVQVALCACMYIIPASSFLAVEQLAMLL